MAAGEPPPGRPFIWDAGCPAPPATHPDGQTRTQVPLIIACALMLAPSLFGFAPGGVCRAASVAGNAVRSYRTVSPLPRHTQRSAAVCSLWHFPWGVTPAGCYPAPYIHGARTFLHGSLSAIAAAAVQ